MGELLFENLKILRDEMYDKDIPVIIFSFAYNGYDYFVVAGLLTEKDHSKYALLHLRFIDKHDLARQYDVYANRLRFLLDAEEDKASFKHYLHIAGANKNEWDWLSNVSREFSKAIPQSISDAAPNDQHQMDIASKSLCSFSGDDSGKIYIIGVKTNGKNADGSQKYRRNVNSELAKLRYPDIFHIFEEYSEVSFCFSANKKDEKNMSEILENFRKNRGLF